MIVTEQGMIIKYDSKDNPLQKRGGIGIRGIMLKKGDKVVAITSFEENNGSKK